MTGSRYVIAALQPAGVLAGVPAGIGFRRDCLNMLRCGRLAYRADPAGLQDAQAGQHLPEGHQDQRGCPDPASSESQPVEVVPFPS